MNSEASTTSSNPSLESISRLLHRVSSKASKNLFGSQLTAIDCQLHVSSSSKLSNTNEDDDKPRSNGGLILSQSRLLIHQDLQHEAIPEDEYLDDDELETVNRSFFKLLEITHKNNNEICIRIVDDDNNSDGESERNKAQLIPKSNPQQSGIGESFLIVHRRNDFSTPNNSCPCCYNPNSSATAMIMMNSLALAASAMTTDSSELRQECTILCVGDRSAGKTTFASIVSGLSLSIQRVLRLHATSLVNVWFDPSERDLQYFVDEFDNNTSCHRRDSCDEASDKNMGFVDCDDGKTGNNNINRSLPLLPSQLCITSLHGLTEDVDLFLEDDELLDDDDNERPHQPNTMRIISSFEDDHDCDDYDEEETDAEAKAENKPNFTSIKIVEVGGDLLDVMVQQEKNENNNNNNNNSGDAKGAEFSSEMLLIESAKNIFGTAQSILYFFDARNLVVVSSNCELERQQRQQQAVDDFKYFLKCRKQRSSTMMSTTSLILVFSRIPAEVFSDQQPRDKSGKREENEGTLLAEKLFGIHSNGQGDDEKMDCSDGLIRNVSFFDCFVKVAIRFMRLKRCSFSRVKAMLIPDFSAILHQSSFLGNLEDSSLVLLQEALKNGNASKSLFKLSNNSFINHARLAQLLFACYKFAIKHDDKNNLNINHNDSNDQSANKITIAKVFELTNESCCKAIQFVFEENQHRRPLPDQEQQGNSNNLHVMDDDFCLSRNLEYCPPLFLARNVPQLLKLLVILEGKGEDVNNENGAGEELLIVVPVKGRESKNNCGSDRDRIFVTLENCLALFKKYERKSLLSFSVCH